MANKIDKCPCVLVVADKAETAYFAQYLLQQCGYSSDTAMDVKTFSQAYAQSPTIIMLDTTMSNGVSEEIITMMVQRQAAKDHASQHQAAQHQAKHPIIFIGGKSPEQMKLRRKLAEAAGLKVAAVLYQPFWIEDIVKVMALAVASLQN